MTLRELKESACNYVNGVDDALDDAVEIGRENLTALGIELSGGESVKGLMEKIAEIEPARLERTLYFSDITVSDWDADETYADYSYRASVALTDVEATMLPDIVYDVAEATSGNYAPVCAAYSGGVYIYSKVDDEITIPSIKCEVVT